MSAATTRWTPSSWHDLPAQQLPEYPDADQLKQVLERIAAQPPLVFAGEARDLTEQLARVSRGEAFLLQGGDCAETFDAAGADITRDKLKVILQMAIVLTYGAQMPIVKVGRIAGQMAKPRSSPTEVVDGVEMPSYKGDAVNGLAPILENRIPDPTRLERMYHHSASTLNLVRAFTQGGFADLQRVHAWNQEFVAGSPQGQRYEQVAQEIDRALNFMRAIGLDIDRQPTFNTVDVFTSHEALLLDYEEAMTRQDSLTGDWYDCSAHMLWIGERTRQLDGAHMHFLSGVHNPIGCKVGPTMTPDELLEVCDLLNPDNVPGRLTLISRMGVDAIEEVLPPLLTATREGGRNVVWVCDPCHGNTITSESGYKTRRFDDVLGEIRGFFAAHTTAGTVPGGVHMELTGEDVTECLGGDQNIADLDLAQRYETACDPRLNNAQSLELAFQVAEMLRS
ncbi:class II 3-deoxy-7-phosphoheptulonate synthase [Euzebya sp.]|uniref:class II 3-deoxy-7-phosphoheptulonate synthase n=1 Tax=Euzebya sp. TaxID=1971409 RepID=UPI003518A136